MQSMEAVLSLLVFSFIASSIAISAPEHTMDDSLYRMQLANDAWRILYLRNDLQNPSDASRAPIERDMGIIGDETGLCLFLNGTQFTNCRGGESAHPITATLRKTVICDGSPASVAFSLAR
jgi:hypothetical protein